MNKYYTPEIEEFHVGFECEGLYTDWGSQTWSGIEINDIAKLVEVTQSFDKNPYDEFRVKYLDDADIEELGFRYIMDSYAGYYTNDKINIAWYWNKQGLEISQIPDKNGWGGKKIFSGKVKNKSELVKLLKMIEIN